MGLLARAISELLDTLAPPTCAACDAASATTFCPACSSLTRETPRARPFEGVPLVAIGSYRPPLSTAIVRLKYQGRAELARQLALQLAPALEPLALPSTTVLVPVPLHARRLAARGYNQAALIAQELSRTLGLRCAPRLLQRTRETERQVGKARAARLTNLREAFALRKVGPRHALLVDDVVTTGSTVRACAQALARGGVELVAVAALAEALTTTNPG